jgi:ubiquitin fusion degradation protein 1
VDVNDTIIVTNVQLPKGALVKLRPQQKKFIELSNPKVVLEHQLSKHHCLARGDTFTVTVGREKYQIDVLEVRSNSREEEAVSIVEADVKVEFERPLDMPDSPEKPPATSAFEPTTAGKVIGGGGLNFANPQAFVPPSLTASKPKEPEPAKEELSFKPFAGAGRTLNGKSPQASPATPPAQESSSPKPAGEGSSFQAFSGKGRSLR